MIYLRWERTNIKADSHTHSLMNSKINMGEECKNQLKRAFFTLLSRKKCINLPLQCIFQLNCIIMLVLFLIIFLIAVKESWRCRLFFHVCCYPTGYLVFSVFAILITMFQLMCSFVIYIQGIMMAEHKGKEKGSLWKEDKKENFIGWCIGWREMCTRTWQKAAYFSVMRLPMLSCSQTTVRAFCHRNMILSWF